MACQSYAAAFLDRVGCWEGFGRTGPSSVLHGRRGVWAAVFGSRSCGAFFEPSVMPLPDTRLSTAPIPGIWILLALRRPRTGDHGAAKFCPTAAVPVPGERFDACSAVHIVGLDTAYVFSDVTERIHPQPEGVC